ncbi:MAG: hypothetical protein AAF756_15190 [Pseudomonadota bacterium]
MENLIETLAAMFASAVLAFWFADRVSKDKHDNELQEYQRREDRRALKSIHEAFAAFNLAEESLAGRKYDPADPDANLIRELEERKREAAKQLRVSAWDYYGPLLPTVAAALRLTAGLNTSTFGKGVEARRAVIKAMAEELNTDLLKAYSVEKGEEAR